MTRRANHIHFKLGFLFSLAFCAVILLWTAAGPFSRAFRLMQINYNEGWNVYNTQRVAEHELLYPSAYGWTAVNYPALSFHLVAALGRTTSDYLFTARILSLAALCLSGVFAGLIVWHTTRSAVAAWLNGLFLVAFFCSVGNYYVGVDDPQILAQAFFLAGLYVYLRGNRSCWALELTALLFVVGGNIKHNLIEFPLAVLLDLLFTSPHRALRYAIGGGLMATVSVLLTSHVDGGSYVSCLLTPRAYSSYHTLGNIFVLLVPALVPLLAALLMACYCWRDPSRRVLALLMVCALVVDVYFSGGIGVSINGIFGSMLAITLLTGIFWAEFSKLPLGQVRALPQAAVCAIFFLWLVIPMSMLGDARLVKAMQRNRDAESRFALEVDYLRQQPGPALCESLLRCAYAGKPFVYDPFNATRFITLGKLDANVIVDHLKRRDYRAVQLDGSVEQLLVSQDGKDRFAAPILQAIQKYYRPGLTNEDGVIYLPVDSNQQITQTLPSGQ